MFHFDNVLTQVKISKSAQLDFHSDSAVFIKCS